MNLCPVNGRIIIEIVEPEEATSGGIFLPHTVRSKANEKPEVGIILAIDFEEKHDLNDRLKIGMKILFNKFAATPIEEKDREDKKKLIMLKDNILGIYN